MPVLTARLMRMTEWRRNSYWLTEERAPGSLPFVKPVEANSALDDALVQLIRYHWPYDPLTVVRDQAELRAIRRQSAQIRAGDFDLMRPHGTIATLQQRSTSPMKGTSTAKPWEQLARETLGDNPVCNPVSMGPLEFQLVRRQPHEYLWSIKNDGTRYTLVFCRVRKEEQPSLMAKIAIDGPLEAATVAPKLTPLGTACPGAEELRFHNICVAMDRTGRKWLVPCSASPAVFLGTVLDCEFTGDNCMVVLDVMVALGVAMGRGEDFDLRLALAKSLVRECEFPYWSLITKPWYTLDKLADDRIVRDSLGIGQQGMPADLARIERVPELRMDGLIFMPRSAAVRQGTHHFAFKWKLNHTLDFMTRLGFERSSATGTICPIVIVQCKPGFDEKGWENSVEDTSVQYPRRGIYLHQSCLDVTNNTWIHDLTSAPPPAIMSASAMTIDIPSKHGTELIVSLRDRMPTQQGRLLDATPLAQLCSAARNCARPNFIASIHAQFEQVADILMRDLVDTDRISHILELLKVQRFVWCDPAIVEFALFPTTVRDALRSNAAHAPDYVAFWRADPVRIRTDKSAANAYVTIRKTLMQSLLTASSLRKKPVLDDYDAMFMPHSDDEDDGDDCYATETDPVLNFKTLRTLLSEATREQQDAS